jgi:hypothetical protein
MSKRNVKKSEYPVVQNVMKGVYGLLHLVSDMEKRGVTKEIRQGEIRGKTEYGKDLKMRYQYGVKIGLDDVINGLKKE